MLRRGELMGGLEMDVGEGILIAAAGIGAVLGVINLVWALRRERVRLRVTPVWKTAVVELEGGGSVTRKTEYVTGLQANPDGSLGVQVTNLGLMDITITSVGVTPTAWPFRRFTKSRLLRRAILGDADNVVHLPHRLAPREGITIWGSERGSALDAKLADARRVYVRTACGLDVFASSRLFRKLVREAKRIAQGDGASADGT